MIKAPDIRFSVNVDGKLALDKYDVDESNAHIVLREDISDADFIKLVLACPAGLYRIDDTGQKSFDYAGCLECGTCRVLCKDTGLEKWEYPIGTKGIEYRFG